MAKVKYSYQRDGYSCGPTALLNIMRWAGQPITKKSLMRRCGGRNKMRVLGTDVIDFNNVLIELPGIIVDGVSCRCSLHLIDQYLDAGGIVATSYKGEEVGHYIVILEKTNQTYLIANAAIDRPTTRISRKNMRKLLDMTNFCLGVLSQSVQWFIMKDE